MDSSTPLHFSTSTTLVSSLGFRFKKTPLAFKGYSTEPRKRLFKKIFARAARAPCGRARSAREARLVHTRGLRHMSARHIFKPSNCLISLIQYRGALEYEIWPEKKGAYFLSSTSFSYFLFLSYSYFQFRAFREELQGGVFEV